MSSAKKSSTKNDLIKLNDYKEETDRNDINSELNFGGFTNGEAIEKKQTRKDINGGQLSEYNPTNDGERSALKGSKSTNILAQAPTKKSLLEPMDG